ncbi:TetR/AcrR family transcriptional regulator [Streptomyces olivaceiscleroticus]|uniref:TetR/AcrR family transcriptional regulator n=1 Tax=Streptomyces olivaceiscleroticus TaxID=68245 RepID=A0ABN1B533_9ACTN
MDTTTDAAETAAPSGIGTRERILVTTARLLQRQGYEASGIKQIAREAGATLGSVYHFFPGGKQALATEAIRHSDHEMTELLRTAMASAEDPGDAVVACTRMLGEALRASDWADGCPVTTTALEAVGRAPDLERACAEAHQHWQDVVRDKLRAAGIAAPDADELALTVINTLEGAELSAQLRRSEKPLLVAGHHLERLIRLYL